MSLSERIVQWWQDTTWAPPLTAGVAVAVAALLVFGLWPSTAGSSPEQTLPRATVTVPITEPEVVVHVSGAVSVPGVYRLEPGSRVVDVVDIAGGLVPGAEPAALNLAAVLRDGDRIHVPAQGAESTQAGAASTGLGLSPVPVGPLDLNSATVAELDELPGIGPALAQAIIDDRESDGPFASVDDLGRVSGIGTKTIERLRDLIDAR